MKKTYKWLFFFLIACAFFALASCDTGNAPEEGLGALINPGSGTSGGGGTDPVKSRYDAVLEEAANIKAVTKVSADTGATDQDGKPVYIGFYWVTPGDVTALDDAIAVVKTETEFLLGAGISSSLLDSYAEQIQAAVNLFAAARVPGTQPLNWNDLDTAWLAAKGEYDGINLDTLNAIGAALDMLDYDASAVFKTAATPAAYETFGTVLTEAKDWIDAGKAAEAGTLSQDEIDAKLAVVQGAPGIFSSSLAKGYWVSVPAGKFQRDATAANISEITVPYNMGA
ncbi:MAG: hypothetical protein LBK02_08500, partial [Treponema sp.]|nr:hypothetical protein [Treponema sp.]